MMQAFSAIVDGLVSFFISSQAIQNIRFSSLYSDRKNSRKTSLPFEERNIISKLRDQEITSSGVRCWSSVASMLFIFVQVCLSEPLLLSSFQRHLQHPHQHRKQVGFGWPGSWGGPSRPWCLFHISEECKLAAIHQVFKYLTVTSQLLNLPQSEKWNSWIRRHNNFVTLSVK